MKPPPHRTERETPVVRWGGVSETSIRHVLIGRRVGFFIDASLVLGHFAGNERVAVVAKLRDLKQVTYSERTGRLPLSVRVLIAPRQCHGIPGSLVAFLAPDGGLDAAKSRLVDRAVFRFCNWHETPPKGKKNPLTRQGWPECHWLWRRRSRRAKRSSASFARQTSRVVDWPVHATRS